MEHGVAHSPHEMPLASNIVNAVCLNLVEIKNPMMKNRYFFLIAKYFNVLRIMRQ